MNTLILIGDSPMIRWIFDSYLYLSLIEPPAGHSFVFFNFFSDGTVGGFKLGLWLAYGEGSGIKV